VKTITLTRDHPYPAYLAEPPEIPDGEYVPAEVADALLANLKSLCDWCEAFDFDGHIPIADAVDKARAAIAKATGEDNR